MSKRPAWVQPSKCAAHPWRPLQWDHVSQAQLIAFEAGLRGAPPSPRAADQQPSQPCRTVAWEKEEQLAAGSRQAAPHQGQQQQRQQQQQQQQHLELSHKLCDARQDSRAGMLGHAWATPAGISRPEAARVSDSRRSCSPVVRHSTQGYAALHKPKQAGTAAPPSTCRHSHAQRPLQHPSREPLRHQSARKQQSSADGSCFRKTAGASDRPDVQRDNKMSPHMACMSPSPARIGASFSPGKDSPNKAVVGPSKMQNEHAAGSLPQPVSARGNAQPAALAHGSSQQKRQQKRQHKRGLSASPAHMQNWARWESDLDKVRCFNLEVSPQTQSAQCLPAQLRGHLCFGKCIVVIVTLCWHVQFCLMSCNYIA